jgi:HSP20 family protein
MPTQRRTRRKSEPEAGAAVGLGGLFKGIGDFIDLLADMAEKGEKLRSRSGEIEGLPKGMKGVYGFNVRTGLGGTPQVQQFGNVHSTERGAVVDEVREPMVDVFDEKGAIVVLSEMPGVGRADIEVEVKEDVLSIQTAATAPRKYAAEVLLPTPVEPDSMKIAFKNGVLELRFQKKEPAKRKAGTAGKKKGQGRARAR